MQSLKPRGSGKKATYDGQCAPVRQSKWQEARKTELGAPVRTENASASLETIKNQKAIKVSSSGFCIHAKRDGKEFTKCGGVVYKLK